jgi:urate oxidase
LSSPSIPPFILCHRRFLSTGQPTIKAGLYGMKLMKTTQSAFVNFVRDEFRSLPDMDDRIFCTVVEGTWTYGATRGLDFNRAW